MVCYLEGAKVDAILPHTLREVQEAKPGKGLPVPLKAVDVGVGRPLFF